MRSLNSVEDGSEALHSARQSENKFQIFIHALCKKGPSLREGMTGDTRPADFNLEMVMGASKVGL